MAPMQFVKVNTGDAPKAGERFAIGSIPTLILFDKGKERARLAGAVSANELTRWVQSHLRELRR
jgi:thioredoxin 2